MIASQNVRRVKCEKHRQFRFRRKVQIRQSQVKRLLWSSSLIFFHCEWKQDVGIRLKKRTTDLYSSPRRQFVNQHTNIVKISFCGNKSSYLEKTGQQSSRFEDVKVVKAIESTRIHWEPRLDNEIFRIWKYSDTKYSLFYRIQGVRIRDVIRVVSTSDSSLWV